jgi:urease accessory protein
MKSAGADQSVEIHAEEGALLEYLPDPTILFPRARLASRLSVRAHPGATVILGDALILHDPQGNGGSFDCLESETRIEDDAGTLLACDRFRIAGGDLARGLPGINGRFAVQATLFAVTRAVPAAALVVALREALVEPGLYAGATLLPNRSGAWTRILAPDAVSLRAALFSAWAAVRLALTGTAPMPRRK